MVRASLALGGIEHLLIETTEEYRLCRIDQAGAGQAAVCEAIDSPVLRGVEIVGLVANARPIRNTLIFRFASSDAFGLNKNTCQPASSKVVAEIRKAAKELSKRRMNKVGLAGADTSNDEINQVTSIAEAINRAGDSHRFFKDEEEEIEGITVVVPPYEEPTDQGSYDPWLDIELQYILAELDQIQNDPYASGSESCKKGCDAGYKLMGNSCNRIFHPAARAVRWVGASAAYASCLAGC